MWDEITYPFSYFNGVAIPTNQNVKYECFHCAFQIFHIFAGSLQGGKWLIDTKNTGTTNHKVWNTLADYRSRKCCILLLDADSLLASFHWSSRRNVCTSTMTCDSLPWHAILYPLFRVTSSKPCILSPLLLYSINTLICWCGIMNTQHTEIKLNHVSLGHTFETKISRIDNITESKWWATVALSYLFPDAIYRWLSNILWTVVGESKLTCRYNEIQNHCIKS